MATSQSFVVDDVSLGKDREISGIYIYLGYPWAYFHHVWLCQHSSFWDALTCSAATEEYQHLLGGHQVIQGGGPVWCSRYVICSLMRFCSLTQPRKHGCIKNEYTPFNPISYVIGTGYGRSCYISIMPIHLLCCLFMKVIVSAVSCYGDLFVCHTDTQSMSLFNAFPDDLKCPSLGTANYK